jgi:hypothetical protein
MNIPNNIYVLYATTYSTYRLVETSLLYVIYVNETNATDYKVVSKDFNNDTINLKDNMYTSEIEVLHAWNKETDRIRNVIKNKIESLNDKHA